MKIIDIHCHPSMKPYNNSGYRDDGNIWTGLKAIRQYFDSIPGLIRSQIQETARDSQAHLNEFIKGNIISAFIVIHPVERGWFARNTRKEHRIVKWLLKRLLSEQKLQYLGASLTGSPLKKIEGIFRRINNNEGIDYYTKESFNEYKFLKDNQHLHGPWGFSYEIVNNYDAYKSVIAKGKVIPVILTIEGGHALTHVSSGDYFSMEYEQLPDTFKSKLKNDLKTNIGRLKGNGKENVFDSGHTPFFVTLSHMYNNFLAGHAKTYGRYVEDLLDQVPALDEGITEAGWLAIDKLLSKENGQRILIDVKHLSTAARLQYYDFIKNKREEEHDPVPIIASHAAMNGFEHNDLNREDTHKLESDAWFSRWSINLTNDDIKTIHESDGLIGVVIHEGRMPGKKAKKLFCKLKKHIRKGGKDTHIYQEQLKNAYLKLILGNLFQVAVTINSRKAWEHICIGSDYDGIMDPFDIYKTSSAFQDMMTDIQNYLMNPGFDLIVYRYDVESVLRASEIPDYYFGYSPLEIVEHIAHKNAENFLSRYFTTAYLK